VRDMHTAREEARERFQSRLRMNAQDSGVSLADDDPLDDAALGLPPLQYSPTDAEGWTTIEIPLNSVYAGKGPFVSADLMHFPVSLPDDGLIDVTMFELTTRMDLFRAMDGAPRGKCFWMPTLHYVKASAYRVEPYSAKGNLSVDGEAYPFEAFEVEVHKGLARLLSPCGYYQAEFDLPKDA